MLVLEKDIETHLRKRVESLKGKCYKFVSFEEGVPDRIAVFPGGRVVFVETKRPVGGVVSPMQKYQHEKLRSLGCRVEVLTDKKLIDGFIEEIKDEIHAASLSEKSHNRNNK